MYAVLQKTKQFLGQICNSLLPSPEVTEKVRIASEKAVKLFKFGGFCGMIRKESEGLQC